MIRHFMTVTLFFEIDTTVKSCSAEITATVVFACCFITEIQRENKKVLLFHQQPDCSTDCWHGQPAQHHWALPKKSIKSSSHRNEFARCAWNLSGTHSYFQYGHGLCQIKGTNQAWGNCVLKEKWWFLNMTSYMYFWKYYSYLPPSVISHWNAFIHLIPLFSNKFLIFFMSDNGHNKNMWLLITITIDLYDVI